MRGFYYAFQGTVTFVKGRASQSLGVGICLPCSFIHGELRLRRNTLKMNKERELDKTVAFVGHKFDNLNEELDAETLNRITAKLNETIEMLYDSGYVCYMYSTDDAFGRIASQAVLKFADTHKGITLFSLIENRENDKHIYYHNIKYFVNHAVTIVFCDCDKQYPEIFILNR